MQEDNSPLQQKLKIAAYLLIAGLIVEMITLYWFSPLSFMLFMAVSGTLVVLGIIIYLLAIVAA